MVTAILASAILYSLHEHSTLIQKPLAVTFQSEGTNTEAHNENLKNKNYASPKSISHSSVPFQVVGHIKYVI